MWDGHEGEWSQEREKEQALRKFVLLDTNADNKLTADVRGGGRAGAGWAGGPSRGLRRGVACRE